MDRRRYIVVNPDLAWIQGDLVAIGPREAVARMEGFLAGPTTNVEWRVHVAPDGFPAQHAPYAGNDPAVHAMLDPVRHLVVPNGNRAAPLAIAC